MKLNRRECYKECFNLRPKLLLDLLKFSVSLLEHVCDDQQRKQYLSIRPLEEISRSQKKKMNEVYTCLRKNRNEDKIMQPNTKRTGQNKCIMNWHLSDMEP